MSHAPEAIHVHSKGAGTDFSSVIDTPDVNVVSAYIYPFDCTFLPGRTEKLYRLYIP